MRRIAMRIWQNGRLSIRGALLLICVYSFLVTLISFAISPVPFFAFIGLSVRSFFLIPLLNWLPVLLCMLLLFFITSSAVGAMAPVSFVVLLMAVTNRIKLQMRGDPLTHWDLSLVHEVWSVVRGFGWLPILLGCLGIVLFIGLSVWCGVRIRTRRLMWHTRLIGALVCVAAMAFANFTLYSSKAIEAALPVRGSEYNQADVHNARGNLYEFIYGYNASRATAPEGYSAAQTRAFIREQSEGYPHGVEAEARPHIIMIMGEAFSDLSESNAVDFDGYQDPLAGFKALGAEGITGHLVVPGRGGGTADTEFDVLTGRAARYLRFSPYAYRMIVSPTTALPSVLGTLGYESFALHPGFAWFYNRQNVYRSLGFDTQVFEEGFAEDTYAGWYVREDATFDKLLSMIDVHFAENPGSPLFGFCLTIQNHAPYAGRFVEEGTVNFATEAELTDAQRDELANYFAGVGMADAELARLAVRLEAEAEPCLIVYYGDHLPALDADLYELLLPAADGLFVEQTRMFTVPFLIWGNAAAREAGLLDAPPELPENGTISSNYLGAYLLELLGYEGVSPFFDYANEVRTLYPVLMDKVSFTAGGEEAAGSGDEELLALRRYRDWIYYCATTGEDE